MTLLNQTQKRWALFGLATAMAATRFHHFGSVTFLPDASLAVFFLAGLYLTPDVIHASGTAALSSTTAKRWIMPLAIFAFLLLEAGLIDYLAIRYGGVSDWCVTTAYLFLIPTYGVMYLAGSWCMRVDPLTIRGMLKAAGVLLTASALAFLISNGSFYLFSDRLAAMNWTLYAQRTAPYFRSYALYTLLYSGIVLAGHCVLRIIRAPTIRPAAPKSS